MKGSNHGLIVIDASLALTKYIRGIRIPFARTWLIKLLLHVDMAKNTRNSKGYRNMVY